MSVGPPPSVHLSVVPSLTNISIGPSTSQIFVRGCLQHPSFLAGHLHHPSVWRATSIIPFVCQAAAVLPCLYGTSPPPFQTPSREYISAGGQMSGLSCCFIVHAGLLASQRCLPSSPYITRLGGPLAANKDHITPRHPIQLIFCNKIRSLTV